MGRPYVNADGEIVDDRHEVEENDGVPVALPLRFTRQSSLNEVVRNMIRSEALARAAEAQDFETFDESDDFDVSDDYDPRSPYEEEFEGLSVAELRRLKLADDEASKGSETPLPTSTEPKKEEGAQ